MVTELANVSRTELGLSEIALNRMAESHTQTKLSYCPDDLSEDQCKAMVPPHTGHKKVLVTGGAGFIGSHVAELLLARGGDVIIVDNMNNYYDVRIKATNLKLLRDAYLSEKRLVIYHGDICDTFFIPKSLRKKSLSGFAI